MYPWAISPVTSIRTSGRVTVLRLAGLSGSRAYEGSKGGRKRATFSSSGTSKGM